MYSLQNKASYQFPNSSGDGIYVLDLQRLQNGIVAITSDQRLTAFAPDRLESGPVFSTTTAHENLTNVRILDDEASLVATTGSNGIVSLWDLRDSPHKAEVARFQGGDAAVMSIACDPRTNTVVVGTELQDRTHTASIFVWDIRSTPSESHKYTEVHSDDITELKFHPTDANFILSGSTDGLVNVCDLRITDEDEVVVQTFNHGASIHHADFLTATEVYGLSNDERFALYDMAEQVEKGSAFLDVGDLRKPLGCQYIANVTTKIDGSGAIIGAGSQDQQAFTLVHMAKGPETWALDQSSAVTLPGAHGEELVRGVCFFDESHAVFTGGEDGAIKGWVI
ncbi:hypothetical protein Cpir12675_004245 [Ceratocystis pirilliformis]|uniref:WD repeat-containing protein C63.06 n=1 Tax=Ceratocystis pirilliformis TaxID=259994 RepID=A0ABR3YYS1_9PEZI